MHILSDSFKVYSSVFWIYSESCTVSTKVNFVHPQTVYRPRNEILGSSAVTSYFLTNPAILKNYWSASVSTGFSVLDISCNWNCADVASVSGLFPLARCFQGPANVVASVVTLPLLLMNNIPLYELLFYLHFHDVVFQSYLSVHKLVDTELSFWGCDESSCRYKFQVQTSIQSLFSFLFFF